MSTTKSLLLFSALVRVPPVALVIFGLRILADPPAEVGEALAYAVREALTNVLKHADPRCEVHLFAESTGERLEVVVRDRGPGFEPDEVVPGATDRLLALPTEYGNIFLRDGRPVVRRSTDIGGLERGEPGQAALGGLAPGVAAPDFSTAIPVDHKTQLEYPEELEYREGRSIGRVRESLYGLTPRNQSGTLCTLG